MKVFLGIPCYQNVAGETLEDYMRLAYYCGRRMPEHDFFLGIRTKSEQFRARNAIVEGALQTGCDYLMFLDDDHVIDWETTSGPNSRYGMISQFIEHFDNDPNLGIVGGLYYQRGADCKAVIMKEGKDGGFFWMRDDEITNELQEVAVQGGGCMMIRMSIFDKIRAPWFEPEFDMGTDLQICKKARDVGFKVACDTSIKIGHVISRREIVTPQNRVRIATENARQSGGGDSGINTEWLNNSALNLYRMDAEEYLGVKIQDMASIACKYDMKDLKDYQGDLKSYYASRGKEQLARQVLFHHTDAMKKQMELFHSLIDTSHEGYGAEYGCGSAPVSFEIAMRGHRMDFIDIDGSAAYEFTKWRAKKRGIEDRCGWRLKGPYNYVLMLDSLEHIEDWRGALSEVIGSLKEGGGIITNYFQNEDYANPEHVSMDKPAVKKFLTENGVYPIVGDFIWCKKDLGFMDKPKEAA